MKVIKLYADGGCRGNSEAENKGGWGVYLEYGDIKREINGGELNTTNNKMELTALIEGLKAIKKKDLPVEVYLDSAYVLNGITEWIHNWKARGWKTSNNKPVLNQELWIALDVEKSKFSNIKFIKVKGHSGNYGNEIADRLCNDFMDTL